MMSVVAWLLASYLLGAIPTSYLAGRWFRGIDLREHGSRNLGATNLYRVMGWKIAIPPAIFRGLIAEELIKHDLATIAALPALPRQMIYVRPWYAGTTRYPQVDEMATCASE